ncbi:MoxR-like ATPase [Methylophaga thiooxydans]|uniref:MoxR-like ATPase n=1 Tax=Methylophaga thiooxydans TaxID=392484 RepID=A0A0A0BH92_9GAMM|nr:MoxR family ATPase [Methylophaga thiooxydans]KGM06484.1 MoxR-like ATPase [Methylophaga thiooxydans]
MPQTQLSAILASINDIILGKNHPIKLALTCLLAKGHLLIEDLPGVGKTTLAHTLASALGLSFQRIQFTSDMLPADIIGVSVYERDSNRFNFHPGPIFTQLILADEINRASPRTQSALLEAMEEQQVTVEGETYNLSSPFFVVATQNPMNQVGTFPLPESQLDRFLMRIELGYPDAKAERALLLGEDRRSLLQKLEAVISADQLEALQQAAAQVHVSTALVDYVQRILTHTRDSGHYHTGLSPRAGLGLIHAARAWALIENRDHVLPEDIQAVLPSIVAHRLQRRDDDNAKDWVEQLIHQVPIP